MVRPELKEYMEKVIEALKDKSPKEVLSYAIFNEEDEVEYYRKLAEHARRESIRVLFLQMAEESLGHKEKLLKLFRRLYPGEEPVKVEAPPVEVAPFYPKFETVDDYLEALEYCMESELFARETYEILAQKAVNEDSRVLFVQLAEMERDHYLRLKKAYELLTGFKSKKMMPEDIEPGGYIFPDKEKARYVFLDLAATREGYVFSRDPPEKVRDWMKRDVNTIWISPAPIKGSISPRTLIESKENLVEILRRGNVVLLLENLEFILAKEDFGEVLDLMSTLRDAAIAYGSYLLVHTIKDAIEKKEWVILTSELKIIED
ncbi:ferritin family protein [Pyrococcus kukulkanii]|uniref:ferritin family protein n=1 Tax=Pyrococcus kukulkanii TaxID=1609559 RepID=UPI0035658E7C